MNIIVSRFRPLSLFPIVLLFITISSSLRAQDPLDTTGRWKTFDLRHRSGFLSENELTLGVFFSTLDVGYYIAQRGPGVTAYRTSNGGATWDTTETKVPVPHTMFDQASGIAPNGSVTSDGGRSWKPLSITFHDPTRRDSIVEMTGGSRNRIAVLYSSQRSDSPVVGHCNRLTLTTDGGKNWRFLDSTIIVADTVGTYISRSEVLLDTIAVGALPYPEGTIKRKHTWLHLLWMNDSIVLATSILTGVRDSGEYVSRTYIWTINIATGKGQATEVPRRRVTYDGTNLVGVLDTSTIYEVEQTSLPDAVTAWWSTDRGVHWDSVPAPLWLNWQSIRFFSPTLGISSNGITHDGGRTWTKWATPFAPQYFQAIDSIHFVGANNPVVFMRSSDAGRTWTINDAAVATNTILAQGGDVLMARGYQSMLKSSDSGETLREVGRGGGVPSDLRQINYMFYPDTTNHLHVVAIGQFIEYDATSGSGLLESRDGGETWKKGMALPELDKPATSFLWGGTGDVTTIQFVHNVGNTGLIGFLSRDSVWMVSLDSGTTWIRKQTLPFVMKSFSMADDRHGAAVSVVAYGDPGGIWTTSDGGINWTWAQKVYPSYNNDGDIRAFDSLIYRARFVDVTQGGTEWRIYSSNDGGSHWTFTSSRDPYIPANALIWLDTTQTYNFTLVNSRPTIGYSGNGGRQYAQVGKLDTSVNVMPGIGVPYTYYAFGNTVARFRVVVRPQGVGRVEAEQSSSEAYVVVLPNVGHRGERLTVRFNDDTRTPVELMLTDVTGRSLEIRGTSAAMNGSVCFDLPTTMANGYYSLTAKMSGRVMHLPILVVD